MELKTKLVQLRKKKGLSQLELAAELNVSRQAISRWESGNTVPSTENFKHLAKLYDVPLAYLLRDDEWEPEEKKIIQCENKDHINFDHRKIILTLIVIVVCATVFFVINSRQGKEDNRHSIKEIERSEITTEKDKNFNFEW